MSNPGNSIIVHLLEKCSFSFEVKNVLYYDRNAKKYCYENQISLRIRKVKSQSDAWENLLL